MEQYIKIYSYKKIKVKDDILDVLYLENLVPAEEENGQFKVLSGKFQGKYLKRLDNSFANFDFCCQPITLVEKNLLTSFNLENTSAINIDNYRNKCKYEYFIVLKNGDDIVLHETDDEAIIEGFKHNLNPSVASEVSSLIEGSKDGRLILSSNLVDKMFGDNFNLPSVDSEKKSDEINIKDYKISKQYEKLKNRIVGLDDELKIILANIEKNISLSKSPLPREAIKELKTGILIMGPRGTGKTFMIESMADLFGVPSTIEDSTRYSSTAYKGNDVEDILIHLYANSGEQKDVFEHGIVFLDEIDKICKRTDPKDYVLKENLQNCLLTILRGTIIHIKVRKGFVEETLTLDTSKLTFVLSGAFEEIIGEEEITKDDLIEYGMIPQLADRIHLIVKTKNPSKAELKTALMDGEFSYLKLFGEYLSLYGVPLEYDEEFIDYIVEIAYNSGEGYRALSTALTEYLSGILYELYDGKLDVVKLSKKAGN